MAITGVPHFKQVVYSATADRTHLWGMGIPAIIRNDKNMQALLVYPANSTDSTGFIEVAWAEFTYNQLYAA